MRFETTILKHNRSYRRHSVPSTETTSENSKTNYIPLKELVEQSQSLSSVCDVP